MKKNLIVMGIVILGLALVISGCTQQNNNPPPGGNTPKTVTMTAGELLNDLTMEGFGTSTVNWTYNSLADGDTLILQDVINNISYDTTADKTQVKFNTTSSGGVSSSAVFYIKENITGSYAIGDAVNITVTIKQVTFELNSVTYNMEVFQEQYEQTDFQTSMFNPAMPQTVISKA